MTTQTEVRATSRQLWFLHLLTKTDTREWLVSKKEASDMITVLKARKIEQKNRIEIASAPVKELNAGPDPGVIMGELTEIVNDEPTAIKITCPLTGNADLSGTASFLNTLLAANVSSARGA